MSDRVPAPGVILGDLFKLRMNGIPWTWLRRVMQLAMLALFLWLFRITESNGTADLNAAVNVVFRIDPLVAASAMLAGKQLIALLWPALVTAGLTLLLGRFFCGWICPLGTLLDGAHHLLPHRTMASGGRRRMVKFFLLGLVLVAALLGVQLIGFFNPFSILVRGLALAVDPMFTWTLTTPFTWLLHHAPESVTNISEPVYAWLKAHVLAFAQEQFVWSWVSLVILLAVFALELIERRFWCRNLCPTGALLGLLARFSVLNRLPLQVCPKCKAETNCGSSCRMGAFDEQGRLLPESCNLCMDCVDDCPANSARFRFKRSKPASIPFEPSRRLFLASVAAGVALPAVARGVGIAHRLPADLIRPPGTRPEQEFLDVCVRCGECMKVCTTNALQPVLFESGITGVLSPRLMPRMGYCEYNCTLCGQVCPTGAIRLLPLPEKQKVVIGLAVFDKDLCLPFAKGESCITCEEHCPLPEKAIRFKDVEVVKKNGERVVVKQPFTVLGACIGCGVCVTECPLDGAAGVQIVRSDTVPRAVRQEYEKLESSVPASRPAVKSSPY